MSFAVCWTQASPSRTKSFLSPDVGRMRSWTDWSSLQPSETQNAARELGLIQLGDDAVRAVNWFSTGAHQLLADLRLLPPP